MTDLLPVDEMSDRLDLIEVIRNNLIILTPGRPLDHIQFSYLIGMSLKDLRMFLNITGPATVLQTINGLGKLTAHFFNKRQQYFIPSPKAPRITASPTTPSLVSKDSGSRYGRQGTPRRHPARRPDLQGSSHRRAVSDGRITKLPHDICPTISLIPPYPSRSPPSPTAGGGSPKTPSKGGNTLDSAPSSIKSQGSQVQRTESTIDECKRLDQYRCIVTGIADPQVCHIVPFSWNQDEEHLEKTQRILGQVEEFVLGRSVEAKNASWEIIKGVKSSDKPWNVLCLSPQLRAWWGKAFFGFKYDSATLCEDDPNYSIISLQFVWMPCNVKAMAKDQGDLEAQRDPSTALGSYLKHRYGQGPLSACTTGNCTKCRETQGVKCHEISSNRPIESGTIIKVKRLTEHRGLFEHVIKLQWSVIRAAALSGGPLTTTLCLVRVRRLPKI